MVSQKKLNVLLVSQFLSGGGLERMVHLLGACLHKEFNCEVDCFSFDKDEDSELVRHLNSHGLHITHSQKSDGFSFRTVLDLSLLLWRRKTDVIHTHETAPLMYAVLSKFLSLKWHVKIVHTQHSFIHLQSRSFIRIYDKFFSMFATAVTVVSEQVQNEYLKMDVPKDRVKLIQNGVEFPQNEMNDESKFALRKELSTLVPSLQTELKSTWLMGLARVHPKKGQDHLIRMWKELPESIRKKSLLIFVGPETEPGELNRLNKLVDAVPDRHRIVFAGSTQTPVRWLMSADIYLSASEYEGMPLAPIEACGAGLPVVLSDIQGHQVLKDHAWFFDFNKPKDIASAVMSSLDEKEGNPDSFAAKCRKNSAQIQELYSITKMTEKYYKLYL